MTRSNSTPIAHSVDTANIWLGEIARDLRLNRHGAWAVLCAVLHTLRDRLTPEQTAHLGNQLPLIIRGALYDRWRPGHKAKKIHKEKDFLNAVAQRLPDTAQVDAKRAVLEIFAMLRRHPTDAIRKILRTLPAEIRALGNPEPSDDESSLAWE